MPLAHLCRVLPVLLAFLIAVSALGPRAESADCARTPNSNSLNSGLKDGAAAAMRPLSADYFLDPAGARILATSNSKSFVREPCRTAFRAPHQNEALWLRFSVGNHAERPATWMIDFAEPIFGQLALFDARAPAKVLHRNGRAVPHTERATATLRNMLPVTLAPGETRTFLLRVSGVATPRVTPMLLSERKAAESNDTHAMMTSAFLGFLLAVLVISLVLFRHVEIDYYRYYAIYVTALVIAEFIWGGWLHHLTATTLGIAGVLRFNDMLTAVSAISLTQFCRVMLNLGADAPGWNRLLTVAIGALVVAAMFAALDPWVLNLPLNLLVTLVMPVILLYGAIRRARQGMAEARPLVAGFSILMVLLFVSNLIFYLPPPQEDSGAAPDPLFVRLSDLFFYLAILSEAVCMALAIATRVRSIQAAKSAAAAEALMLKHHATKLQSHFDEQMRSSADRIAHLEARLIQSADANGITLSPSDARFVAWATEKVQANLAEPGFGVRELAAALGTSEKTLGRRLKQIVGETPVTFIRRMRLERARDLILIRQYHTVAETAYAVGFSSTGHFAKLYRENFGESPHQTLKAATASALD